MCGRFVSSSPPDEIARYFDADPPSEAAIEPSYNVAPTSDVYVILEDGGVRKVGAHHWGLVPFWAKDPSVGNRMINARAEGLTGSNAYKRAFAKRRCIVPADGFYEWRKIPGERRKQPYFIQRADGEPLAFAGLWEEWRGPKDDKGKDDKGKDDKGQGKDRDGPRVAGLRSTTIITTSPNELMATIHDRMPVILPPSAWDTWLDPDNADLETLGKLLVPAPSDLLVMHPVALDVGNVKNQGEHLTDAIDPAAALDAEDPPGAGTE